MVKQQGFSLIELMIVVAILGVIVAIALPSYQSYIKKTKRGEMMTGLQNIASQIQAQKLAKGNYKSVDTNSLIGDYPKGNEALYTVSFTPESFDKGEFKSEWQLIATPKVGKRMAGDGDLTLSSKGIKCYKTTCGQSDEWRK